MSKNWHWMIVYVASLSFVLFFVHLLFMPESPKWLYEKQRYRECLMVFEKMAKFNGKQLQSGALLLTHSMKQVFDDPTPNYALSGNSSLSQTA